MPDGLKPFVDHYAWYLGAGKVVKLIEILLITVSPAILPGSGAQSGFQQYLVIKRGNGKIKVLPSGYVKIAIENGPVEIVDFPINSMVIFHSYVKLPEGTCKLFSHFNHVDLHL